MYSVVALGLLLLAGLFLILFYPIWVGISASKDLPSAAYEYHPSDSEVRILVAGDSTGVGTGAQYATDSIAGRLQGVYPTADITNISENGLKLRGLREKLAALPERQYDVLLLQIGANDVIGLTKLEEVASELRAVLEYAEQHSDHTVVVTSGNIGLAPIFRPPLSHILSWRTRQVRRVFLEEVGARERVHYIDLYKDRENEPFNTNIPLYYAADRFHPSGAGYGLWFKEIEAVLPSLK